MVQHVKTIEQHLNAEQKGAITWGSALPRYPESIVTTASYKFKRRRGDFTQVVRIGRGIVQLGGRPLSAETPGDLPLHTVF